MSTRSQRSVLCCRYERTANDMLAKSTIAGQEGVITYLANAAALQQFEQTALAYVLISEARTSMGAPGLAAAAESLLEGKFEVCVLSLAHAGLIQFPACLPGFLQLQNQKALIALQASSSVQCCC